jgi:hypothetical protein
LFLLWLLFFLTTRMHVDSTRMSVKSVCVELTRTATHKSYRAAYQTDTQKERTKYGGTKPAMGLISRKS